MASECAERGYGLLLVSEWTKTSDRRGKKAARVQGRSLRFLLARDVFVATDHSPTPSENARIPALHLGWQAATSTTSIGSCNAAWNSIPGSFSPRCTTTKGSENQLTLSRIWKERSEGLKHTTPRKQNRVGQPLPSNPNAISTLPLSWKMCCVLSSPGFLWCHPLIHGRERERGRPEDSLRSWLP
jgi:hypothetical protein